MFGEMLFFGLIAEGVNHLKRKAKINEAKSHGYLNPNFDYATQREYLNKYCLSLNVPEKDRLTYAELYALAKKRMKEEKGLSWNEEWDGNYHPTHEHTPFYNWRLYAPSFCEPNDIERLSFLVQLYVVNQMTRCETSDYIHQNKKLLFFNHDYFTDKSEKEIYMIIKEKYNEICAMPFYWYEAGVDRATKRKKLKTLKNYDTEEEMNFDIELGFWISSNATELVYKYCKHKTICDDTVYYCKDGNGNPLVWHDFPELEKFYEDVLSDKYYLNVSEEKYNEIFNSPENRHIYMEERRRTEKAFLDYSIFLMHKKLLPRDLYSSRREGKYEKNENIFSYIKNNGLGLEKEYFDYMSEYKDNY